MKFLLFASIVCLTSCSSRNNNVIYEIKGGSRQKAVLTIETAKLNVGDGYHVYVLFENENIKGNDYGIVFSANNWNNALPRDSSLIRLKWISDKTLKISYDKRLRILNQVIKTRDNEIVYEEIDGLEKPVNPPAKL